MKVDRSWLVQAIRNEVLSASMSPSQLVRVAPSIREMITEADFQYIKNEAYTRKTRVIVDPALR